MPLVSGTVESHKIPSNDANIKIVISFLGRNIKTKNRIERKEYKIANKFFFENDRLLPDPDIK